MRILFTRFPLESASGGAENQTLWLMEGLRAQGHIVEFLGDCPVISSRAKEKGFTVHDLTIGPPPVSKWTVLSFFWRKNEMQKKLKEALLSLSNKPDAIFMLSLSEKILLSDSAVSNGIKVFWVEHDRIGPWLTKNPWLPVLKKAATNVTVIGVSDLTKQMMMEMGFQKVIAIPNGIPLPVQELSPKTSDVLNIGTVARLSQEKGIDVLIQSIENIPDANLTIVGKGSEEGYLRSLILADAERIGQSRITLVSHVDDLEKFYASLDVFVLPSSEHDPFGLVAAEAMSRGIPTIVTNACGIAGYLENGKDALIVEAGLPDAIAKAFKTVINPETRARLSAAGRTTARTIFSLETMVKAYEATLRA